MFHRSVLLAVAVTALPLTAVAADEYGSEPAEVTFQHDFDAFDAVEFDTGSLPAGSPLAVRFYLASKGGTYATMDAVSDVTWPESLTQRWTGIPDSGYLEVICDLELAAQVTFDLWGYKGAYDVWSETLYLEAEKMFQPLLLEGDGQARVEARADGKGIDPYEIEIPLFAGLELQVVIEVFPRATAALASGRIETEDTVLTSVENGVLHDVPEWTPEILELTSTYVAQIDAALEVVIQPKLEICAPIFGCFRVAKFDIPIPLVDDSLEEAFKPVNYGHPLPVLEAPVTTHHFGEVEVETLANLQLPLTNAGLLDLEGTLSIEGDPAFTVFPEYIQASADQTDGAVVTFAPTGEGEHAAILVITINDPSNPELRIPLGGTGWVEPIIVDDGDPDGREGRLSGEVRGCGCDASSSPSGGLAVFGLIGGLMFLRRRRK